MSLVSEFAERVLAQGSAVSFATRMVGNRDVAEDLATESVYQLLKSEASLIERQFDERSIRQYFFKILRYRCYDYYSSIQKEPVELNENITPGKLNLMAGDKLDLSEALAQFDEITRSCLLMVGMGHSHSFIAETLAIKLDSVTARLGRARRKLRSLGFTDSDSQLLVSQIKFPPLPPKADKDMLDIYQLARLTSRNPKTVNSQLEGISKKYGIVPKRCRNELNQHLDYWPTKVLAHLVRKFSRYPEGGDWYTVGQLAVACEQDPKWIRSNLKELETVSELRRASNGKIHPHYPPETLPILKEKAAQRKKADGWVTRYAIKRALDCTDDAKVKCGLAQIGAASEKRDKAHGQCLDHYDPKVIQQLREPWDR